MMLAYIFFKFIKINTLKELLLKILWLAIIIKFILVRLQNKSNRFYNKFKKVIFTDNDLLRNNLVVLR